MLNVIFMSISLAIDVILIFLCINKKDDCVSKITLFLSLANRLIFLNLAILLFCLGIYWAFIISLIITFTVDFILKVHDLFLSNEEI